MQRLTDVRSESLSRMKSFHRKDLVRRCSGGRILTVAVVLAVTAVAGAQATDSSIIAGARTLDGADAPLVISTMDGSIQASIPPEEQTAGHISIPIGTSTVLDLNVPATRVEITNPQVATLNVLSPRQVLIAGQAVGVTQLIVWDENQTRLAIGVTIAPNLAQLKAAINASVPFAQIDAKAVGDAVMLTGRVTRVEDADRAVGLARLVAPRVHNQIIVAGEHQVLLRCTVAEVSKSAIRRLGVDAWAAFENFAPTPKVNQFVGIDTSLFGPVANIPGVQGTAFYGNEFLFGSDPGGFQFGISSKSVQMEVFVRAMKQNGLLRVLAEPNLVSLSGEMAEFLAGGQFPVPVPQNSGGGTTITVEWKDYGVMLRFVPTVIGEQRIRLEVAPEISEIDFTSAVQIAGFVVPGVTQRRAHATLEMEAGTTIAMAGLLSEEVRAQVQKVPYLGDVPVLGSMFRSVEYQRDLTELMILVTPELVTAMQPDQVPPVPGQNMTHPNDWELYGLGMIEGEVVAEEPTRNAALQHDMEPRYRKFSAPPDQMSVHGPWGPAESHEVVQ